MAKFSFIVDESDVKTLVLAYIQDKIDVNIKLEDLKFEVKSKNNYRQQEWEIGELQVSYNGKV